MDELLHKLTAKKEELDRLQPLNPAVIKNLDEWYKIELTYTSNAIEGNTLSRVETKIVVEDGLTVEGKSITEHLEAVNHGHAFDFMKSSSVNKETITEAWILDLHRIILQKIDDQYAGRYRDVPVRISGSTVILPNALKVPELMQEFIAWLQTVKDHPVKVAADAHIRFESIHPFVDGNGRVGRLLMNRMLIQSGYPPAIIQKEERRVYITSLEKAQAKVEKEDYYKLIFGAVDRSFDIYLNAGG